MYLRIIIAL